MVKDLQSSDCSAISARFEVSNDAISAKFGGTPGGIRESDQEQGMANEVSNTLERKAHRGARSAKRQFERGHKAIRQRFLALL